MLAAVVEVVAAEEFAGMAMAASVGTSLASSIPVVAAVEVGVVAIALMAVVAYADRFRLLRVPRTHTWVAAFLILEELVIS